LIEDARLQLLRSLDQATVRGEQRHSDRGVGERHLEERAGLLVTLLGELHGGHVEEVEDDVARLIVGALYGLAVGRGPYDLAAARGWRSVRLGVVNDAA
jgi:hypothetical protein